MSEFDHQRAPGRTRRAANLATPTPGKQTLVQAHAGGRAAQADVSDSPKREMQQFLMQIQHYFLEQKFGIVDIGDPSLEAIAASARRVAKLLAHHQTDAIREWAMLKPKLLAAVGRAKQLRLEQGWLDTAEGAIETVQEQIADLVEAQAEEKVDARRTRAEDLAGGTGLDGSAALAEMKQGMSAARKAYERAKLVVSTAGKGVEPARAKAGHIRNAHAAEVNIDHTLQLKKQTKAVTLPKHDMDPGVKALHGTPAEVISPGVTPKAPASARGLDAGANVAEGIGKLFDIFEIIETPSKIEDKLANFQSKSLLGQTATVLDVLSIGHKAVANTMVLVLEIVQPFVSTAAANGIAQHISFLKGVGTAFSAVEIVAGTLNVIDAVQRGDERAVIDSGADVATGAVGLLTATGAGAAAVGGMLVGTIFMWKEGLKAFGEMGATLRTMKDRAAKTAVMEFIDAAHELGDAGAALAAAEEELVIQSFNPAHADYRLQQKYEATLEAMIAERREVFRQRYLFLMDKHIGYHDPERVGGYPDLVKELGLIPRDPDTMAARWSEFAKGIKRMSRYALAFYGGDENDARAYHLTAGGIADKDNPFLKM